MSENMGNFTGPSRHIINFRLLGLIFPLASYVAVAHFYLRWPGGLGGTAVRVHRDRLLAYAGVDIVF